MHSKWAFIHFYHQSRRQILFLATLWFTGLLFGILLCSLKSYDSVGILHRAVIDTPAPFALFLVCVLPVALTAIAVSLPLFGLIYPTVVLTAVSHGFSGTVIYIAQGSAAWLLRPLLLFSASCTSVLMWWLLLQDEPKRRLRKNVILAGVLSCVIFLIDLLVISPLVGELAKYF